jgi:murein DD-endopeptidase MepM/ murein hydrolase activator NlpD
LKRSRLLALTLGGLGLVAVVLLLVRDEGEPEGTPDVLVAPIATTVADNGGPFPKLPSTVVPLQGFTYPIAGGCLPRGNQLMPGAPRPYRNGIHEGVDFYGVDNCTPIAGGTHVQASRAGIVVRADNDYANVTLAEVNSYMANPNTEEALDKFRGRQVWVDHGVDNSGQRVVTRYCHLSGIAPGVQVGTAVAAGQLIAFVGESGTPESVTSPGSEFHLHWELRLGDSYLGRDQPAPQVRSLYTTVFSP